MSLPDMFIKLENDRDEEEVGMAAALEELAPIKLKEEVIASHNEPIPINAVRIKSEPIDPHQPDPVEHVTILDGSLVKTEILDESSQSNDYDPIQMAEMCDQQFEVEPTQNNGDMLLEVMPNPPTRPNTSQYQKAKRKTTKPKTQICIKGKAKNNPQTYQCVYCCKKFRNRDFLTAHMENDVNFGSLDCLFCIRNFPTYKCCVEHMDTIHLATNPIQCEVIGCLERFHTIARWDKHMREEHSIFMCNMCQQRFKSSSLLKVHRKVHRPSFTNLECRTCKECGKVLGSISNLQEHLVMVHEVKRVECNECHKVFMNHQRLYRHTIRVHRNPTKLVCQYCGLQQTRTWSLNTHIDLRHNPDFKFQCPACHYRYPTADALSRHTSTTKCKRKIDASKLQLYPLPPRRMDRPSKIKSENPELVEIHRKLIENDPFAMYQCLYCHLETSTLYSLDRHMKANFLSNFIRRIRCLLCECDLPNLFCLRYHVIHNHGEQCEHPECDTVGLAARSIGSHIEARHTLIECALCNAVLRGKQNWINHLVIHNKRKQYACKSCDMSYHQHSILIRHSIRKHGGIKCSRCAVHIDRNNQEKHRVECRVKTPQRGQDSDKQIKTDLPATGSIKVEQELAASDPTSGVAPVGTPDFGSDAASSTDAGGFVEYMFT